VTPPVVLLHAGIADRRMWAPQLAALREGGFEAIATDRRGFGAAPPATEPFSHLDDLRALLDERGLDRAHLVGCSQGGGIALSLAIDDPARVASLFLISTAIPGVPPSEELRRRFAEIEAAGSLDAVNELELRLWVDGPHRTPEQTPAAVRALAREMNAIALAGENDRARPLEPIADRLGEIAVPTTLVAGRLDEPDTLARCALAAMRIPGARSVRLAGAAHLVNLERADAVNRLLLEHLRAAR
jgi:pimeloyl-ACP methyl ester carboxylesterase